MPVDRDRWPRIAEIVITILASAVVSAVTVSWTLSASLTELRKDSGFHDQKIAELESTTRTISAALSAQQSQIAGADAHWQEIQRRLDSIDKKLERK